MAPAVDAAAWNAAAWIAERSPLNGKYLTNKQSRAEWIRKIRLAKRQSKWRPTKVFPYEGEHEICEHCLRKGKVWLVEPGFTSSHGDWVCFRHNKALMEQIIRASMEELVLGESS